MLRVDGGSWNPELEGQDVSSSFVAGVQRGRREAEHHLSFCFQHTICTRNIFPFGFVDGILQAFTTEPHRMMTNPENKLHEALGQACNVKLRCKFVQMVPSVVLAIGPLSVHVNFSLNSWYPPE